MDKMLKRYEITAEIKDCKDESTAYKVEQAFLAKLRNVYVDFMSGGTAETISVKEMDNGEEGGGDGDS